MIYQRLEGADRRNSPEREGGLKRKSKVQCQSADLISYPLDEIEKEVRR